MYMIFCRLFFEIKINYNLKLLVSIRKACTLLNNLFLEILTKIELKFLPSNARFPFCEFDLVFMTLTLSSDNLLQEEKDGI